MEMVRIAALLLAGVCALGQTLPEMGSIKGCVVSVTGDPVGKSTVTLLRASGTTIPSPGNLFPMGHSPTSIETGIDGSFSFLGLAPGQYTLRVDRPGYAPSKRVRTFALQPGQAIADFIFKVTPQAVITGHVTDADGDPLENAGVNALRESYNRNGKQWVTIGSARTDSRGAFRIAALPPGRYLVLAGARNYGVETFYPGSLDRAGAGMILADAGSEHSGIDIRIRRNGPPRFSIRGKAIMITGGRVARGQSLTIKTRDGQGGLGPAGGVRDDGSFEIKSVKPGTYLIQTLDAFSGSGGVVNNAWTDKGQVEVTVTDRDVEDVLLAIRPAMKITGAIKVDGDGGLTARPTIELIAHDVPFNGANPSEEAHEDGSFEIGRLGPVLYDVELRGLPSGMFVRSRAQVDLTGGSEDTVEIVLSPHAASVSGAVQPGAAVALWHKDGIRTAAADEQGAFRFDNLAPGDYRILAWEDVEDGLPEYAPFRERFEDQATRLTLAEDEHITAQMKTISRDASQDALRRIP